jgi:hypothetical protein
MKKMFNNAVQLHPHTLAMREKAAQLWRLADGLTEENIEAGENVIDPEDIKFCQATAADLERYSLQPTTFALNECPVYDDGSLLDDCTCDPFPDHEGLACRVCREAAQARAGAHQRVNGFVRSFSDILEML